MSTYRYWNCYRALSFAVLLPLAPGNYSQQNAKREARVLQTFPENIVVYRCIWINTLMGTLKPQSNGPRDSNTVIGTMAAADGWLLHLIQRGGALAGCGPVQSPARCTKCNSPPINSKCADFILFDVAL